MTGKPIISEARAEKMVDQIVWRRLETDRAYRHAESSEAAADREEEIGEEVWAEIQDRYEIA